MMVDMWFWSGQVARVFVPHDHQQIPARYGISNSTRELERHQHSSQS